MATMGEAQWKDMNKMGSLYQTATKPIFSISVIVESINP